MPPPIVPLTPLYPICYRTPLPTNEKQAMALTMTCYPWKVARQKGIEPLAGDLEGLCSIQLSYWRILKKIIWLCPKSLYSLWGWNRLPYTLLEAFLRDKGKHHRSNNFRGVAPFTPPLPLSYYRVIEVGSDRSILRNFEKTSAMSGSGMIYI